MRRGLGAAPLKNRPRLGLPDRHPYQPEPDGRRLPQLIWPELLPDLFTDHPPRTNAGMASRGATAPSRR